MRRLAGLKNLRSRSQKSVPRSRSTSSGKGAARRDTSSSSTSRDSSCSTSYLTNSQTTSTDYSSITDSQLTSSQLNTSDYNSISEASSTDVSTNSFVSIDADSEEDTNSEDSNPGEAIVQRESRSRYRRGLTEKKPNQQSYSDTDKGDRLQRKIAECIRSTLVPIEENQTVIENDAGFMAQKINMMGQVEWNRHFPPDTIVIYTDGSCLGDRASGFGIYYGPSHELNRAHKLHGPEHNSGFAEIAAATTALNDLRYWNKFKSEKVIIRSDYLPLIQAMQNEVQNENSRFTDNYSLLQELCSVFPNGVAFQHVYAHDLDGDPGNDAADEFARQGVEHGAPARSRSQSADVNRNKKRDRSKERGRSASRDNNRAHIRSHSAFVPGKGSR